MSTETKVQSFGPFGDVYVGSASSIKGIDLPPSDTSTISGPMRISKFGTIAAPFALMAAMFAPAPGYRRVYSQGGVSSSAVIDLVWDLEADWKPSRASTTQAEIDELNQLFRMSPPEGIVLELPDA